MLVLHRVVRGRITLLFTARRPQIWQFEWRLEPILNAGVLLASRRQAPVLRHVGRFRGFATLRKAALMVDTPSGGSARLIDSFACVLGVQVPNTMLVEVFLLDQRQVRISLHLGERLLPRDVFLGGAIVELAGIDGAGAGRFADMAHLAVGSVGKVLPLGTHDHLGLLAQLSESVLLSLHVTVIRQIWIVRAPFVLERLDRRREVNLALEEFLARYFVEFIGWVAVGWHVIAGVVRADGGVLGHLAELHADFVAAVRRGVLLLVEV